MVEARGVIGLVTAAPKDQHVSAPIPLVRHPHQAANVVRANCPLESVQEKQARSHCRRVESKDVDEIVVRGGPALDPGRHGGSAARKLSPEGLSMGPRYPPRGVVRMFAR